MKKLFVSLGLILICTTLAEAQSKLSYSILVNESYSRDNYSTVCVNRPVLLPAGSPAVFFPPLCLDKAWKTSITLNTNYKVNPKLRLQGGAGLNVMHLDKVNGVLGTSRYKAEYLSIPIRAHYFLTHGKVRLYIGGGVRMDFRLKDPIPYDSGDLVADNTRNHGVSYDLLIGIEVPLSERLKLHLEPTYTEALTSYTRAVGFPLMSTIPGIQRGVAYEMMPDYPSRAGASLGITFDF